MDPTDRDVLRNLVNGQPIHDRHEHDRRIARLLLADAGRVDEIVELVAEGLRMQAAGTVHLDGGHVYAALLARLRGLGSEAPTGCPTPGCARGAGHWPPCLTAERVAAGSVAPTPTEADCEHVYTWTGNTGTVHTSEWCQRCLQRRPAVAPTPTEGPGNPAWWADGPRKAAVAAAPTGTPADEDAVEQFVLAMHQLLIDQEHGNHPDLMSQARGLVRVLLADGPTGLAMRAALAAGSAGTPEEPAGDETMTGDTSYLREGTKFVRTIHRDRPKAGVWFLTPGGRVQQAQVDHGDEVCMAGLSAPCKGHPLLRSMPTPSAGSPVPAEAPEEDDGLAEIIAPFIANFVSDGSRGCWTEDDTRKAGLVAQAVRDAGWVDKATHDGVVAFHAEQAAVQVERTTSALAALDALRKGVEAVVADMSILAAEESTSDKDRGIDTAIALYAPMLRALLGEDT